jgi:hypothetical protein
MATTSPSIRTHPFLERFLEMQSNVVMTQTSSYAVELQETLNLLGGCVLNNPHFTSARASVRNSIAFFGSASVVSHDDEGAISLRQMACRLLYQAQQQLRLACETC